MQKLQIEIIKTHVLIEVSCTGSHGHDMKDKIELGTAFNLKSLAAIASAK